MDTKIETPSFLSTIFTTNDAEEYVDRIDHFLSDIYTIERKSIQSFLDETLPENISKDIKDYLLSTNTSLTNQEEVRVALIAMQQIIRSAKILSLTIAFVPSKKMTTLLCKQVKNQFGNAVIVEMNTNPDLIGGAIIVFEGKYVDKSIKQKLAILFEAKKDEILKFLQ